VLKYSIHFLIGFFLVSFAASAQRGITLSDDFDQYIFSFSEIEYLEDPTGSMKIEDVVSAKSRDFQPSPRLAQ
jgi:two-component system, sensor histidine kinase LadS